MSSVAEKWPLNQTVDREKRMIAKQSSRKENEEDLGMDGNGTHGLQNTSPAHIFTLLWLRGSTRVQVDLVNALGPLT